MSVDQLGLTILENADAPDVKPTHVRITDRRPPYLFPPVGAVVEVRRWRRNGNPMVATSSGGGYLELHPEEWEPAPAPADEWQVGDWLIVTQKGYASLPRCAYQAVEVDLDSCFVRIVDCYGDWWTVMFADATHCEAPAAAAPVPERPPELLAYVEAFNDGADLTEHQSLVLGDAILPGIVAVLQLADVTTLAPAPSAPVQGFWNAAVEALRKLAGLAAHPVTVTP